MACIISASVFSADAVQDTSAGMIQPYAATVTGSASSDDESEILSSQDWEALFNVSSEESEPVSSEATDTLLGSPLKNGMSGDSFFIWGCIAVGLGVLGIAFFIYSQFIYKHMKSASDTKSDYHEEQMKPRGLLAGQIYEQLPHSMHCITCRSESACAPHTEKNQ